MIENAAVFVSGQRKYKNVNVEVSDGVVRVLNRMDGSELVSFNVLETAKLDMAWDVGEPEAPARLVVQQGCGCSGMFPYQTDPGYSGTISVRTR